MQLSKYFTHAREIFAHRYWPTEPHSGLQVSTSRLCDWQWDLGGLSMWTLISDCDCHRVWKFSLVTLVSSKSPETYIGGQLINLNSLCECQCDFLSLCVCPLMVQGVSRLCPQSAGICRSVMLPWIEWSSLKPNCIYKVLFPQPSDLLETSPSDIFISCLKVRKRCHKSTFWM